jgi:hypothetical protein
MQAHEVTSPNEDGSPVDHFREGAGYYPGGVLWEGNRPEDPIYLKAWLELRTEELARREQAAEQSR